MAEPGGAIAPLIAEGCTSKTLDLKLLAITADQNSPSFKALEQTLEFVGVPYVVWNARENLGGLTTATLTEGCRAFYQGVILSDSQLAYEDGGTWRSALSPEEWQTLRAYEAAFGVREVSWYTFPNADWGFAEPTATDAGAQGLRARLNLAGAALFKYLNPAAPIDIRYSWTYLAKPLDANTQPLMTDAAGNVLAAIRTHPDGRQSLALTFDNSPYLTHSIVLGYGLVDWVTKGLFLGEQRAYLSAQVDDIFIDNDLWPSGFYRMKAADLNAVVNWQRKLQSASGITSRIRLDLVFNGEGTVAGMYEKDDLTGKARSLEYEFKWINHTWSHLNLDDVDQATTRSEIVKNNNRVRDYLYFSMFSKLNLVTPDVSGLENPNAMIAAYNAGIRYVITDTSRAGYNNPSPNIGLYNRHAPGILMIPRHPANLFYNVSTPAQWTGEYNDFYRGYWGKDLTYQELLDKESEVWLGYLLKGDMDPVMFHQANLRAYDGVRTLLGDLIDATVAKYKQFYKLPILSPTMNNLGVKMARRMQAETAQIQASYQPGGSLRLLSDRAVVLPVTGLCITGAEKYNGECIASVSLTANTPVTLTLPAGTAAP